MSRHRRRRAYRTRLARRRGPLARWWRQRGFSATDHLGTDQGTPGGASKGFWVLYAPVADLCRRAQQVQGQRAELLVLEEATGLDPRPPGA